MKIYILVGTRPNFIKISQFKNCAAELYPALDISIIHTGQHYDEKLADVFFRQFDLRPEHCLNIQPASPNTQIAMIMCGLEDLINRVGKPDLLLVVGDVNSTLAGALFANKNKIRLGHIEAGLRSFDPTMPEEDNRFITDYLADLYFVTEQSGLENLRNENRDSSEMHFVGNTMIDTLVAFRKEINNSDILNLLGVEQNKFVLMTMHRPATVDFKEEFLKLIALINHVSQKYKIVFPIHPRTAKRAKEFGLYDQLTQNKNLICAEPLDYFSFQKLIGNCFFVLTDSGGIQEETTYLQKPCLTFRANTERPVTVTVGSNTLVDFEFEKVKQLISQIENGTYKKGAVPEWWDGKASERILKVIAGNL